MTTCALSRLTLLSSSLVALAACGDVVDAGDKVALQLERAGGVQQIAVYAEEDWRDVETSLPASAHPYRNNTFRRWVVTAPDCAQALRVRFDRIQVERGYDAVILRDGDGALVQYWTGRHQGVLSEVVEGSSLQLELVTDYSITDWGFAVAAVQMIEGPLDCPLLAPARCPEGSFPMPRPRALCECPPPPTCVFFTDLEVDLTTSGGFSGLTTGYRVRGDGSLWSLRFMPGEEIVPAPYGQAHPDVVAELEQAVFAAGLLPWAVNRGEAANMTRALTVRRGGVTSTVYWPAFDAPPDDMLDILTAWKQLLACDDGSGRSATCGDAMQCVDTVCTLTTCANVRCAAGTRCQMQPVECAQSPCPQAPACVPDEGGCVCIEIYAPVCGDDGATYSNSCYAGCAGAGVRHDGPCGAEGDPCGGPAGWTCHDGLRCRYGVGVYEPPAVDAAGACVPELYCEDVADCGIYPHVMCVGQWSCVDARCDYQCGPPPQASWLREAVRFGTPSPYANNQSLGWRVTGDPGTARLRLSFASFELEQGYDEAVLYDASWNEVARYTGALGSFVSAAVEGESLYLVFRSDASVVGAGFVVDAIETQQD